MFQCGGMGTESANDKKFLMTAQVCNSCMKINGGIDETEDFREKILADLQSERPDYDWKVVSTSCMKVCPIGKITMTVSSSKNPEDIRLTLSKEATPESVAREALSFLRPRNI